MAVLNFDAEPQSVNFEDAGAAIARERKAQGMTREEFLDSMRWRTGLSMNYSTFRRIEEGKREPSASELFSISITLYPNTDRAKGETWASFMLREIRASVSNYDPVVRDASKRASRSQAVAAIESGALDDVLASLLSPVDMSALFAELIPQVGPELAEQIREGAGAASE